MPADGSAIAAAESRLLRGAPASAADEEPAYIRAGEEHIFAIYTRPTAPATDLALVTLHLREAENTAHRNRTGARLCRDAAALGVHGLRLDYHGTGDSTGMLLRGVHGQPVTDVVAAAQWLADRGITRIVITSHCYGALVGLVAGPNVPGLVGVAMFNPQIASIRARGSVEEKHASLPKALKSLATPRNVRMLAQNPHFRAWLVDRARRRLGRPTRAAEAVGREQDRPRTPDSPPSTSPAVGPEAGMEALRELVAGGVRAFLVYGDHDPALTDFNAARQGPHKEWIDMAGDVLEVVVATGYGHNLFMAIDGQEFAHAATMQWLATFL
jgi:alpha/beta superfamily hydrolase